MTQSLTSAALAVIAQFESLSIAGKTLSCPYYNNRRSGARAALAVMIGKGSPQAIVEEAVLLSKKKHIDLGTCDAQAVKAFLIEHHIGIDCSGFVYHVLDAEVMAKTRKPLKAFLSFPFAKNPIRKILAKMRPVENTNVKNLAHDANSTIVALTDIAPGDMIIRFSSGEKKDIDHVLLVSKVEGDTVYYAHSSEWPSDARQTHGIKHGAIHITDASKPITEQDWTEAGKTGDDNTTHMRMKRAREVFVRRLRTD